MELSPHQPRDIAGSAEGSATTRSGLLDQCVRLAAHTVSKAFAHETVLLNLKTGTYHGLNPTAGRMLGVLAQSSTVRAAVERLVAEYGLSGEQIEEDVTGLVGELLDRDLIEFSDVSGDSDPGS